MNAKTNTEEKMANGNYQMKIGCSESGRSLIGAEQCRGAIKTEHVYPSQFRYRVVATDEHGEFHICTRTECKGQGYVIVSEFPAANGALAR